MGKPCTCLLRNTETRMSALTMFPMRISVRIIQNTFLNLINWCLLISRTVPCACTSQPLSSLTIYSPRLHDQDAEEASGHLLLMRAEADGAQRHLWHNWSEVWTCHCPCCLQHRDLLAFKYDNIMRNERNGETRYPVFYLFRHYSWNVLWAFTVFYFGSFSSSVLLPFKRFQACEVAPWLKALSPSLKTLVQCPGPT